MKKALFRAVPALWITVVGLAFEAGPAFAQTRGTETDLPIPRFLSLKVSEANLRRGPSVSHRIDWVLVRRGMPLQVTAEYGNWRRVVDRDGVGGWVHHSLLSGTRTAIVDADLVPLRSRARDDATEVARLERGVIARVEECRDSWCRVSADGYRGWTPEGTLWGVIPGEVID